MRGIILPHKDPASDDTQNLCVRVTPEQFGENLNCIAEQCSNHNCHVVFLKPPVPYLWPAGLQFKPFLHLTSRDGQILLPRGIADHLGEELIYCLDEEKYAQLYGRADIFTREVFQSAYKDTRTADEALRYYDEKIHQEPGNPTWYNNLGVTWWRVGEFQKADSILQEALSIYYRKYRDSLLPPDIAAASPILFNLGINRLYIDSSMAHLRLDTSSKAYVYLDSALQSDFFSLRIKRSYWLELDKLKNCPGAAVIDLPEIFRENGGERLFIDHCHPTAEGHILIAQSIYEKIIERHWL
jgi:tetratricopeptide (TPR) repeat protein